jgi:hypothetical protein
MATAAPAQQPHRRRRRRAADFLLPAVAVACLLTTVVVALVLASRLGPSEPALTAGARSGPAAVVASSSTRAKPAGAGPGTPAGSTAPRTGVSPSPDRLLAGSPERATADFATAWQVDAAALGRDLGAPGVGAGADAAGATASGAGSSAAVAGASGAGSPVKPGGSPAGSIASAAATDGGTTSAALAALGQALRSPGTSAITADAPYPSGGLGLAEPHWEQHGRRDLSGVRGWFGLEYRDGNIARIEKTIGAGSVLTLENARGDAGALAPDDAVVMSRGAGPEPVDLLASRSLAARFRGAATKPGDPAPFYVRYRMAGDRVTGYTVAVGNP